MPWNGNHESYRDGPAPFRRLDEPARLVTPRNGFQPDSSGGYGVASLTGDRHDAIAREAPVWFRAAIEALCADGNTTVSVAARRVGSAGKYLFWSAPIGVASLIEWQAATARLVAERDDRVAQEHAASEAARSAQNARERARNAAIAVERGLRVAASFGDVGVVALDAAQCEHYIGKFPRDCCWLPAQPCDASSATHEALTALIEQQDAAQAAAIEQARAQKAARKAAAAPTAQAPATRFAALAALTPRSKT